jgi:hypothetical protein
MTKYKVGQKWRTRGNNLHFTDLTAITCPFGMLDDDTQERLKAWPHGWESFSGNIWDRVDTPFWRGDYAYRAKPAPHPVPARYDAKLDAAEARNVELEAKLDTVRDDVLQHVGEALA